MDPAVLIPSTNTIPVHWGWLEALLLCTFTLHLLLVNSALGSAFIAVTRTVTTPHDPGASLLGKTLPSLLALAINFGVAPLLFAQVLYGNFLYTSSVLMAVYWLGLVFVLMAAYYLLYGFAGSRCKKQSGILYIMPACALLLLAAFVLVNNITLMLSPQRWPDYFNQQNGTMLNLADPALPPRLLHFLLASFAVGGLTMAELARRAAVKKNLDETMTQGLITNGLRWFFWSTVAQLPVGILFFFALPRHIATAFTGRHGLGTGLLFAGIGCGMAALYFAWQKRLHLTMAFATSAVALMVGVRAILRALYLAPWFSVHNISSQGQYTPMLLFFGALLLTGALILWVLNLARTGKKRTRTSHIDRTKGA